MHRNREAVPGDTKEVKTSLTSEDGQNYGTIPMPVFATKPMTTSSTNQLSAIRQVPKSTVINDLVNKIQTTGLKWFRFSIGCHVVDQRSGDS